MIDTWTNYSMPVKPGASAPGYKGEKKESAEPTLLRAKRPDATGVSPWTLYWQAVQRKLPLLLLISAAAAAAAWAGTRNLAPQYQVHFSYLVSLSEREPSEDFRFDGYYALQSTDLFASTLAEWARTPEIVVAAYAKAGIPLPTTDPRALIQSIETSKSAPQLVQVTVKHREAAVAEKLAAGLRSVLQENVTAYEQQGIPALRFRIVPTQAWTGKRELASNVIVIAIFVFTFFIAVNVVLLVESLKRINDGPEK